MTTPAEVGEALRAMIAEEMAKRNPLEQQIIANRVKLAIKVWIKADQTLPRSVEPMADQEALSFENEVMEFGKHKGELVGNVPLDYLEWLADASRTLWCKIHAYLNNPRIKSERGEAVE